MILAGMRVVPMPLMYTVLGGFYINVGVVNKERVAMVPHKLSFPAQF